MIDIYLIYHIQYHNMELHSESKTIDALFELNNRFVKYYPFCNVASHDYEIKGIKRFLGMLSKNSVTYLAIEYVIIGTYTKEKNVWVWSDVSFTMDNSMKREIQSI